MNKLFKGKYIEENREFMEIARTLDMIARKLLIPLLFLIVWASFLFGLPYPLVPLLIIFFLFFSVSEIFFYLMRQGLFPAEKLYFVLTSFDAVLLSFAIYYTGGPESFGPVLFIVIGILAGLNLSLLKFILVTIICIISYLTELGLEAAHVIPHISLFPEFFPHQIYPDSLYLRIVPLAYIVVFLAATFVAYSVSETLRKEKERLKKLNQDMDKSSQLLVRRDLELTKTHQELDEKYHELERFKTSLEARVKERTNELEAAQKDMEEKVSELETFHKLAVGRELKMIALEKEIERLRKNGK